jgi:hypothetical protein
MEHIPAIHAAKVGMRYPARITVQAIDCLWFELDLSRLAPGRSPKLAAILRFDRTISPHVARSLRFEDRFEVVLIDAPRYGGNLSASLPADPAWLSWNNGTVRQLAQRIRETGETVLMPVLADALEEAGCTDAALLDYCRQAPDEVWNWAVELLATQE